MSASAATGRPWLAAAAAVILHLGALRADFVYDDATYIQGDAAVAGTAPAFASATPPDRPELGLYRPLTTLTHRWTRQAFGLEPLAFHAGNLVLHGLCAALVVLLGRRLGLSGAAQTFAGLLFAAHPVHVEAVAWATGRAELLAAALALLALLAHGRPDDRHPLRRAGFAAVLYCGAALAKESALPLPAVFLLLDWLAAGRVRWSRVLPSALAALLLIALRLAVLGQFGPAVVGLPAPLSLAPFGRFELALATIGVAVERLVLPLRLSVHLEPRDFAGPLAIGIGAGAVATLALLAAWLVRRSRRLGTSEPALCGLVLLVVMILPFLHFIPIGSLLADRFLYLPSVGFVIASAALLLMPAKPWRIAVAAAATLACAGLTLQRVPVFHDERSLWEDAARADPRAAFPAFRLGELYFDGGLLESRGSDQPGAIEWWTRSLELDPAHPFAALAHVRLADIAAQRGDAAAATRHYRDAIARAPDAATRAAIERALAKLSAQ